MRNVTLRITGISSEELDDILRNSVDSEPGISVVPHDKRFVPGLDDAVIEIVLKIASNVGERVLDKLIEKIRSAKGTVEELEDE